MKIIIGIPSGQRTSQLIEVCRSWKARGFNICVLTWDTNTSMKMDFLDLYGDNPKDVLIYREKRESFAINQNLMMNALHGLEDYDWDVWICGADDLFPGIRVEKLKEVAPKYDGKLLWCYDGLNPHLMTHPVVTRGYWEKVGGKVFDERYTHNFCDTHLMMTAADDIVKLIGIQFDHRWRVGGEDDIYRIGNASFASDKEKFIQQFGNNPKLPNIHQEILC